MNTPQQHDAAKRSQLNFASGCNLVLGLWLVFSPFLLGDISPAALWNGILVGAMVLFLAWVRLVEKGRTQALSWSNAVLGVWLMIAPFALRYFLPSAIWNSVIVGGLVAALASWSGLLGPVPRLARSR